MAQRRTKLLDSEALWGYALRALSGRGHSLSELREKLKKRAEREADVEGVLGRLKRYGYLDDRRFAESYAESRLGNEGFGRMRVLRDLRQKRVAPALAEKAVQAAYQGVDETGLIEAFLERKYRKISLPAWLAEPRHLAAAYRKLRLAGFSSGNVIRVLKRYAAEAENLEALEPPEENAGG
jgi:regulatory protein